MSNASNRETVDLSHRLPDEGIRIPTRATFAGVEGAPLLALGHNNCCPLLRLFNDQIEFRVLRKQRRPYSSIKSVGVHQGFLTNNIQIVWHGALLTFSANISREDNLVEVVKFLQRKQVPLSPKAQTFLQEHRGDSA